MTDRDWLGVALLVLLIMFGVSWWIENRMK
jgi:hypothetical protein